MKIGIVGVGNMGRNHLRVCRKLESTIDEFSVHVIYDPGVAEYSDKEKFLNSVNQLDGVIVATPSATHVDLCLELLDKNPALKILVEKPVDDDLQRAELLIHHEKSITVGHIERFNPAVRELRSLIEAKHITGINMIRTRRLNHTPSRSSNYVNLDLLVHDIDVAAYLLDAELSNRHIIKNQTNEDGVVDHAIMIGVFNNEQSTVLMSEASWVEPEKIRTLELVCNEGKYCLDYVKQSLCFVSFTGQKEELEVIKSEPLYQELLHFMKFIEGTAPSGCSVHSGIAAVRDAS